MGSGGYSGGNYGAIGGESENKCGSTLIIQLIINSNQSSIWSKVSVDDDVYLNLNKNSRLPIIEILKLRDNMLVGVVPPSYGWVLNCIQNGWKYQGNIIKKEGSKHDPRISVKLDGVK